MADVMVVTDRPEDLWSLVNGLEAGGHRVATITSTEVSSNQAIPDIAIVDAVKDLTIGRDGCRTLRARASRLPLLVLIAPETLDAVGPDWGADSFVVEGASIPETLARIRLALGSLTMESGSGIRVGDLAIDPETYQVRVRGRALDLTYKEFQLLTFLAQKPGRVWSRQQLLQEVWGYDFFGGTRTVDVHVRRLRAKLGAEHEAMIVTIRNVGYKLESHRSR